MFKKFHLDAIRHLHNRVLFPDPPKRIWGQNKLKSVGEIRLLRLLISLLLVARKGGQFLYIFLSLRLFIFVNRCSENILQAQINLA